MIKKSLEIVIPAYNEEENIEKVVKNCLSWLKTQTKDYSVLIVDDGSSDNTGIILDDLAKKDKHLRVIHHQGNLGVGEAWKSLYKHCSKEIIFTCPSDNQFNPSDFSKTLPYLEKADIISIYRLKKQDYSFFRLILTNTNRLLVRLLFNLNIKDINWVKMYKKEILDQLDIQLKSPLIETEILTKAKKRKARIIQIQAPYYPRLYGRSKGANLKQISKTFIELFKLYSSVRIFK